ncbi:MAG: chorismate synthase [Anaerovoracaceae bacterium]
MNTSNFGKNVFIEIFGGSHEEFIGVKIKRLPGNLDIDMDRLQKFVDRRAPGNSPFTSPRKEPDTIIKQSDDPLTFIIQNKDKRSSDYDLSVPRPGHCDFPAIIKYGNEIDLSGGGPFSGRMTAPLAIAGGIAIQYLEKRGVHIGSHIYSIGEIVDDPLNLIHPEHSKIDDIYFPVLNNKRGEEMKNLITTIKSQNNSVGGIIEAWVTGLPVGLGGPMYHGVESILAPILFGIPAVKGLEFGLGFKSSKLLGSENNDPYIIEQNKIVTPSNNHGGILGGLTTGMPLIAKVAFKPTPSIGQRQQSVNLKTMTPEILEIKGRHDPCIVPRAIPVVEGAIAIGLLDLFCEREK